MSNVASVAILSGIVIPASINHLNVAPLITSLIGNDSSAYADVDNVAARESFIARSYGLYLECAVIGNSARAKRIVEGGKLLPDYKLSSGGKPISATAKRVAAYDQIMALGMARHIADNAARKNAKDHTPAAKREHNLALIIDSPVFAGLIAAPTPTPRVVAKKQAPTTSEATTSEATSARVVAKKQAPTTSEATTSEATTSEATTSEATTSEADKMADYQTARDETTKAREAEFINSPDYTPNSEPESIVKTEQHPSDKDVGDFFRLAAKLGIKLTDDQIVKLSLVGHLRKAA